MLTGETAYAAPAYYTGYGDGVGKDLSAFISNEMRQGKKPRRIDVVLAQR
jgi:hypothetical protein